MWTALWNTIEQVTGKPVQFQFMHGRGIRAILVDGCKAQVDACGDDLVKRNKPEVSLINETDPQVIVQYVLKTCIIHLDRYIVLFICTYTDPDHNFFRTFTKLAHHCPLNVMQYVRQLPHFETHAELEKFKDYCRNSNIKALRGMIPGI